MIDSCDSRSQTSVRQRERLRGRVPQAVIPPPDSVFYIYKFISDVCVAFVWVFVCLFVWVGTHPPTHSLVRSLPLTEQSWTALLLGGEPLFRTTGGRTVARRCSHQRGPPIHLIRTLGLCEAPALQQPGTEALLRAPELCNSPLWERVTHSGRNEPYL